MSERAWRIAWDVALLGLLAAMVFFVFVVAKGLVDGFPVTL